MIVIGVDVHKHELTAVAVDELGRRLRSKAARWTTRWWRGGRWAKRRCCGRSRIAGM
jgi:hypothetical protein